MTHRQSGVTVTVLIAICLSSSCKSWAVSVGVFAEKKLLRASYESIYLIWFFFFDPTGTRAVAIACVFNFFTREVLVCYQKKQRRDTVSKKNKHECFVTVFVKLVVQITGKSDKIGEDRFLRLKLCNNQYRITSREGRSSGRIQSRGSSLDIAWGEANDFGSRLNVLSLNDEPRFNAVKANSRR